MTDDHTSPDATPQGWLALRAQGRGRFSEGEPADVLRTGVAAIDLGLVAGLDGAAQATSLRDIASRIGRVLRDREVDSGAKAEFVRRVPKLITDAAAREASDARMAFWVTLLGPVVESGVPLPAELAAAIRDALREQLAASDEIVQWSARHALAVLPATLAEAVRAT